MKRIDLLINDTLYNEYMERNAREVMEPRFCLHDLKHHFDVARITYILVLENNDLGYFIKESGLSNRMNAKEVIYASGLLHDIGKWKEYREGLDHSSYGAKLARGILPRALFNPHEIDIIARAIYEHRNISNDISFLGERLYRADNLSRICNQCRYHSQCPKVKYNEINTDIIEY